MSVDAYRAVTPLLVLLCLFLSYPSTASAQEPGTSSTVAPAAPYRFLVPGDLEWVPEADMPGLALAMVSGSRRSAEPYVYRLRADGETTIAMHTHTRTEYLTVLEGAFHYAPDTETRGTARRCGPGCFLAVPPGRGHQGWLEAGTVIQVHGIGPIETHSRPRATRTDPGRP